MKKVHRFLLPSDLAHQLRDVLKMEIGEEVEVMDGAGVEGRAKIVSLTPSVEIELTGVKQNSEEPRNKVTLYAAILKRENFELIVQKATEVGATEIVPLITARTIKTGLKLERLQKIAGEAAEQSGRGVVPIIHEAVSFKQALIDAARNDVNYFFDTSPNTPHTPTKGTSRRIGLFIGPEGGWTDEERNEASKAKMQSLSLGKQILRGETAAIVATYLAAQGAL